MIRIKNIYYMLTYSYSILKDKGFRNVAEEEFASATDLLARILATGMSNQLKRGLSKSYNRELILTGLPRGKIIVSETLKKNSLDYNKVYCEIDDYNSNTYLNRILKLTVLLLLKSKDVSDNNKKQLRKIILHFESVSQINPCTIEWTSFRYDNSNKTYKLLIDICQLVISEMIPNQKEGNKRFAEYDDRLIYKLYEKFLLEYFKKHYPSLKPSSPEMRWSLESEDEDSIYLPKMKTDIVLKDDKAVLVVDAKYYKRIMSMDPRYNSIKIRENNLYQIFSYVKNMEARNGGNVNGMLLYARTDESFIPDFTYNILGNEICIRTIDLNTDFESICNELDSIVKKYFLNAPKILS